MKRKPKPTAVARVESEFPIVGVGASAGGLEAFTRLLKRLPVDTGMGFVLVQHLDPHHESVLTQLLGRVTAMPVHEVTNNLRVQANHLYVIPPNTSLRIVRGVLELKARSRNPVGLRSIDAFFESLAQDRHEQAIGVILSGTATDGTLGLEAIKAEGGITFAQDESAKFDSMPRSAIGAGCVDFELSPEAIAKELARIAKHPYVAGGKAHGETALPARGKIRSTTKAKSAQGAVAADLAERSPYEKILRLLDNHTGVDFSLYKSPTIHRRITRRAVLNQKQTLESYAGFLRENVRELDALYADTLINVTSFFRNPEAFDLLRQKIFPHLLRQGGDDPVRVWVLGCSTGQEAYSIAMAFAECVEKTARPRKLQVFATDLNNANLDKARHGLYAKTLAQDVTPERLRRFFIEEEGGYRVIKSLRETVVFARQNLISDPPFSRMDLISCRNLMIYLEPSLQKKLIPTFHYALKPAGVLFLGASESIGGFPDLFEPVNKKHKFFVKKAAPTLVFQLPLKKASGERVSAGKLPPAPPLAGRKTEGAVDPFRGELSAEREADRVTVNQFAPPAVLINADLQILQFRGPTGAFLEPPTGKATFDVLKMAREGLMLPLRATINQAKKGDRTVRTENVSVIQGGKVRRVHVEVVPLKNLKERCFLVLFEDVETSGRGRLPEPPVGEVATTRVLAKKDEASRVAGLERDLAESRDYLQSIQEYQESANEELQAANEEGQSANEELQSLNEELETSKEELESTNEELTTVNEEMVSRNSELNRLNSDLTNFQTSTKLVIVLLGRDLCIRRFSAQAEQQFNLEATDLGRPISSVRHNLTLPDLNALITGVISTVRECECEVQDRDGRWYLLRVRPYVTLDNKVDGAVLVLVDVTASKEAEQAVAHARDFAEAIIDSVRDPLLILDADLRVQKANEAFFTAFKISPKSVVGRLVLEIDRGQWDIPALRKQLLETISRQNSFNGFEVTMRFAGIGQRTMLLNARKLNQGAGHREKILLGMEDITARKQAEEALRATRAELALRAGNLEKLVAARTLALTTSNHRLEAAVETTRAGKEEYRALFLASQLMQEKLRSLTRQILTAQEDERKRISRELHDDVVQTLVGINVELAALNREADCGVRPLRAKIAHTQRLVEKSVDAVHRFARELRPAVLDDLGLIPALQAYLKIMAARKKIKISLTAFAEVDTLDNARRTVLYRVAQESLINVARHAEASAVDVVITKIPGAVRMEVCDNGKAFDVTRILSAKTNKRLGLVGMRERVEMLGGTVTIDSVVGRGTTVRAELPFKRGGAA